MAETGDYIVVHLVDRVTVGSRFERRRLSWPLHITLVSWFAAADEKAIIAALETVSTRNGTFEARVGGIEQFGADSEVPVNIMVDHERLRTLHADILDTLQELQVTFRSELFRGDEYKPHITRHDQTGRHANEGDIAPVRDFHLVNLTDNNFCEVVRAFALKGSQ